MLKVNITYLLVLMTWYVLYIIFMIFLYFKYRRPYRVKKINKFYKDIPEKLNPIELSMLIYHKITPSTLSATIVYLIEKGVIVRENSFLIKGDLSKRISKSQKNAMEILFDILGDGTKVNINVISDYCRNHATSTDFLLAYDVWTSLAQREAVTSNKFFVPKEDYELVRWFQIIGYILAILNFVLNIHNIAGYVIIIPAYFILQYFYKTYKRTKEYNEEFYKWLGFSNYISSISSKAELQLNPNAVIIYSIILNKISHVEQVLYNEQFFTELDSSLRKCYRKAFFFGNRKV